VLLQQLSFWADLAGVIGFPLSFVGLALTFHEARTAKSAAAQAQQASEATRSEITRLGTVVDLASITASLEELKTLHRANRWVEALDRYSRLRGQLIRLRRQDPYLSQESLRKIQSAITVLASLEERLETETKDSAAVETGDLIKSLSRVLDRLNHVIGELKREGYGKQTS
jgi:AMMECR1 domain-containing protein